jgi:hypothetical protein
MLVAVVQTGVVGVLWYLWWKLWGKGMVRSSFTGYSIRQRTASGMGVVFWNVTFVTLLATIWSIVPSWLSLPFLVLFAIIAIVVNHWAKHPQE